jgi:hypothetical protein
MSTLEGRYQMLLHASCSAEMAPTFLFSFIFCLAFFFMETARLEGARTTIARGACRSWRRCPRLHPAVVLASVVWVLQECGSGANWMFGTCRSALLDGHGVDNVFWKVPSGRVLPAL